MTEPLIKPNDPDLLLFRAKDPAWFLRAAGAEVRRFAGWHIAPVISSTRRVAIRHQSLILPTLRLGAVTSITVAGRVLAASEYEITDHDCGIVELPGHRDARAEVVFAHGFVTTPDPVKAVTFELAAVAQAMPAGVADKVGSGPFSISLKALGVTLTREQRDRLSPYRLIPVA